MSNLLSAWLSINIQYTSQRHREKFIWKHVSAFVLFKNPVCLCCWEPIQLKRCRRFPPAPLHTFLAANCVTYQFPGEILNTKGSYATCTHLFKFKSSAFVLLEHESNVAETNSNRYSLVLMGLGCVWPWDALKGSSFTRLIRRAIWALSLSLTCKHSWELFLPPYISHQAAASPGSHPTSSGDPEVGCLRALTGERQLPAAARARHKTPSNMSVKGHTCLFVLKSTGHGWAALQLL